MGLPVVLISFVAAGLVSYLLTPRIRDFALRKKVVDAAESSRKIHKDPIPRFGGIAIVAGTLCGFGVWLIARPDAFESRLLTMPKVVGLLGGGLVIAGLGFFDDLRGVRPRAKLLVQLAVAVFVVWMGFRVDRIANPFGEAIPLGYMGSLLTVFWIVGIINALNLIDGLDGLAGGVALAGALTNLVLVSLRGDVVSMLLMATLAGAILGFLIFNFHPASIFMGDTGSMFLGYSLATSSLIASTKSATTVAFFVPIVMLGLPIVDTLFAMLRRSLRGRPVFSADKEHIHHLLLARGLSHRAAVLVLYGVAGGLGGTAVILSLADSKGAMVVLALLLALGLLAARAIGFGRLGTEAESATTLRTRNRLMYAEVARLGRELQSATTPIQLEAKLDKLREAIGAIGATLFVDGRAIAEVGLARLGREQSGSTRMTVHTPIGPAVLTVLWPHGRGEVDRDKEIALERLEPSIAQAIARIDETMQPGRAVG